VDKRGAPGRAFPGTFNSSAAVACGALLYLRPVATLFRFDLDEAQRRANLREHDFADLRQVVARLL
jgi:hypothetical protein